MDEMDGSYPFVCMAWAYVVKVGRNSETTNLGLELVLRELSGTDVEDK